MAIISEVERAMRRLDSDDERWLDSKDLQDGDVIVYDYGVYKHKGLLLIVKERHGSKFGMVYTRSDCTGDCIVADFEEDHPHDSWKVVNKRTSTNAGEKPQKEKKKVKQTKKEIIGGAVKDGVSRATVYEASEALLEIAEPFTKNVPYVAEMYKDAQSREVLKFLIATAVVTLEDTNPGLIPHGDKVQGICKLVLANSTQKVLEPHLGKLREAALKLAAMQETLALPEKE